MNYMDVSSYDNSYQIMSRKLALCLNCVSLVPAHSALMRHHWNWHVELKKVLEEK